MSGDLWGGFAAMLVALPSAIGFGVTIFAVLGPELAGSGALAGLIGTIVLGILAPLLGGSRYLISAPCGPAALLLSTLALELAQRSGTPLPAGKVLLLLTLVAALSGALQLAYGALGGGRLIKYIPYPVVAGYLSSIGVLLFTKQLPDFLGLAKGTALTSGLAAPSAWAWPGLIVGAATAIGMLLGPRLTTRAPGVILGLSSGGLAYAVLAAFLPALRELDGNTLVLGAVEASPSGLASTLAARLDVLGTLSAADLGQVIIPAVTLSVLLSIDTLKTSVIVDTLTRSHTDANRELRGQGLANLASAVLGGIPGAGTMGATLVNVNSGGATRRAGVVEGTTALAAFALFGGSMPGLPSLIGWLPKAALAAIILVIAVRMIDHHSLLLLRNRTTWPDFLVVLAVIVTAVLASPVAAAGVGLALAIMLFTRDQMRGSVVRRKVAGNQLPSKRQRLPEELAVLQERGGEATFCSLHGTLFFGTTDQLMSLLAEDLRRCRYLVLDLRRVQSVDYTATRILKQMEAQLKERGAQLIYCGLPATLASGLDLRAYFRLMGVAQTEHDAMLFDDADAAVEWVQNAILAEAGFREQGDAPPLTVSELGLFCELEPDALRLLGDALGERRLAAGETLFHRGDQGDELFLIRRGAIHVSLPMGGGQRHHLATFTRGSFFGEMAFLDGDPRSADAVAAVDTELYALSRKRFDALASRHPGAAAVFFRRLARIMASRLRQTDAQLQALAEA